MLGKKYNIPVVVTEHSSYYQRFFNNENIKYGKFVLNNSYYTTVSKYMCDWISKNQGKCDILPNLVDVESFNLNKKKVNGLKLITISGLRRRKYIDNTVEALKGLDVLLLEANHDVKMLQLGPYPYPLKQRILGDRGHLSNELSGQLLSRVLHDDMKYIFLGHLSKENNMPELAYEAVKTEVTLSPLNGYKGDDFCISVAKRTEMSELIAI